MQEEVFQISRSFCRALLFNHLLCRLSIHLLKRLASLERCYTYIAQVATGVLQRQTSIENLW